MAFDYSFPVVRGKQAHRDYYVAMVPLGVLSKLFGNSEDYILPEYRAQRCINEARIPEIRDYILDNSDTYVFSALSASIDGKFTFTSSNQDENLGILSVDMNAVFFINDGQHRRAAIEAALVERPELSDETISVVFFKDEGLARSQQMFADLNKHAVKSTMSLSTLYDGRDNLANAVKEVVDDIPFLSKYIDKEKDNLGKNSLKLFTLANFLRANRRIIRDNPSPEDTKFLKEYWKSIFTYIDEWTLLESKDLYKKTLREEYVLTLGITLNAFGRLGRWFYENEEDNNIVVKLNNINWLRNNTEWLGRMINSHGKIVNSEDAIIKMCNYFKIVLDISLSKEEKMKEDEIGK